MSRYLIPALLLALGFTGGLFTGLRSRQVPAAVRIAATPAPEVDLSPAGSPKTILAPSIKSGTPERPPVPVLEAGRLTPLGDLAQTTRASLPALPDGGTFHLATYARTTPEGLQLRPVVWLEDAQGARRPVEASTTTQDITIPLPGPPPPRWCASLLLEANRDGLHPGVQLQRDRGRLRFTVGATANGVMAGIGLVF